MKKLLLVAGMVIVASAAVVALRRFGGNGNGGGGWEYDAPPTGPDKARRDGNIEDALIKETAGL